MRMVGAQIVEVVTRAELQAALSERAALVAITGDFEERSTIPIPEMIAIAHEHGTPTLVDAAAQRPDVPNRYLEMGADAVLYSGGKCLRGPQASGLVLGRKDLLQTAYLHSAPHHALGRPMKAGKEEIMGLLAAYEAWLLGRDHEAEWRMWEEDLERIRAAVAEFPSVQTQIEQPGLANHAPSLVITWDLQEIGATPDMVDLMLREQDPPIHVHCLESGLRIMPYMLERGDSEIIADRLQEILERLTGTTLPHGTTSVDVEVSGDWTVDIAYTLGASTHAMRLEQAEDQLMGRYRSQYACETIKGNVRGHDVEFKVTLGCEANRVTYYFRGTAEGDGIEGTVALGEYGSANWTARRVANDA
jgi:L-seryl-tRNA(Ser) seleniumtransferase